MIRRFTHFYDGLNFAFILDTGWEFFCAKRIFNDKPDQETNFKIHLSSVLLCKCKKSCKICTCPVRFHFSLLDWAHFCNEIKKRQL